MLGMCIINYTSFWPTNLGPAEARVAQIESDMSEQKREVIGLHGRIGAVEGRLGAVEERLGAVEGQLGAVEGRLDAILGRSSPLPS